MRVLAKIMTAYVVGGLHCLGNDDSECFQNVSNQSVVRKPKYIAPTENLFCKIKLYMVWL